MGSPAKQVKGLKKWMNIKAIDETKKVRESEKWLQLDQDLWKPINIKPILFVQFVYMNWDRSFFLTCLLFEMFNFWDAYIVRCLLFDLLIWCKI